MAKTAKSKQMGKPVAALPRWNVVLRAGGNDIVTADSLSVVADGYLVFSKGNLPWRVYPADGYRFVKRRDIP